MHETGVVTAADRSNQRNAVLAGFLGWTLDAFDFFILTLVLDDVAAAFGKTRPQIALAITLTLAMRPLGAVIFGLMADRYGRRLPLMLNVIFYAIISVLCGIAPTYGVFIGLRMLFGIGMGGEWGVGASLALESAPARIRGLLSGLLQEGYALGNLLAALAFRTIYPTAQTHFGNDAWRIMFFIGGLPALLSLFIRARVKEPAASAVPAGAALSTASSATRAAGRAAGQFAWEPLVSFSSPPRFGRQPARASEFGKPLSIRGRRTSSGPRRRRRRRHRPL